MTNDLGNRTGKSIVPYITLGLVLLALIEITYLITMGRATPVTYGALVMALVGGSIAVNKISHETDDK
jgi:hypothetical protein